MRTRKPGKAKTQRRKTAKVVSAAEATPPAEPIKRGRGRPSVYDPAFCDVVIALGEEGKSRTQIARTIGVHRETLLEWSKAHPEFSVAMTLAQQFSQAWWEDAGQVGIKQGRDFNAHAFTFQVRNRFKDDYADKLNVNHDASAAFLRVWERIGRGAVEGSTEA